LKPIGEIVARLSRDQLMSLARRVRHNGPYSGPMDEFMIEREDIASSIERMAEEVGA
jgi:hypothetical protein